MFVSNKLVLLTTGSPNTIRGSLRYQPVTERFAPYQRFDEFQREDLEREFLMNQNPTEDDRKYIAKQTCVPEKSVKVKYF